MLHIYELVDLLNKQNCKPYYVGGCVRDKYLGRKPSDYDLTVEALPEKICEVLNAAGLTPDTDGIAFGTVTVGTAEGLIEITTHRKDGAYKDSRKPETVTFTSDLSQDLARRDFTINAMAMTPDGSLIDPFNGLSDLKKSLLRCVGDAAVRFEEDALRMLRAARFVSKLDLEPDPDLLAGMKQRAAGVAALSDARVGSELTGMWLSDHPEKGYRLLVETGLWPVLFPGLNIDSDMDALASMPRSLVPRLSFVLWGQSTNPVYQFLRRMALPKNLFDDVLLVTTAEKIELYPDPKALRRQIRTYGDLLLDVVAVRSARGEDMDSVKTIVQHELDIKSCVTIAGLQVSGDDLMELGFPAGRGIGITLSYLLDRVMDDPALNQKEKLLSIASEFGKTEGYLF